MVIAVRKPRPPRFTANSGRSCPSHGLASARRGEQRPVAAQDHQQFRMRGDLVARKGRGSSRISRRSFIQEDGDPARFQPRNQFRHQRRAAVAARLGDETDGFNGAG